MRKRKKILHLFILLFLIVLGLAAFLFSSTEKSNIKYYERLLDEFPVFPQVTELNHCKEYSFKYYHKRELFFCSDSYKLVVKYDKEAYLSEKTKIEAKYKFSKGTICDSITSNKSTKFSIDSFAFRMLSADEYEVYCLEYPKKMAFVATSDDTCEIAYLFFRDTDLDNINSSLSELVRKEFNWN